MSIDTLDLDLGLDETDSDDTHEKPAHKSIKTPDRQLFKRLNSERQLEDLLEWEFEPGTAYHIISGGDIDALSFLKFTIRQQPLHYAALSTWCMAVADIQELERYIKLGRIVRLDTYVGEIFKGTYAAEYELLESLHNQHGGRVAIFRNHSKVMFGIGPKFDFVIETSANINTNPRCEQTVITINTELALFYKDFFDSIKSFDRNFDNWKPWSFTSKAQCRVNND